MAKRKRRGRMIAGMLAAFATCGVLVVGGSKAIVAAKANGHMAAVSNADSRDVAMVLGAALWSGRPSPYLAARLDVAIELYREQRVKVILVSGSTDGGHNESAAMRAYLIEHSVKEEHIVTDELGDDTYTSCYRAKHIFGVDKLTVITQTYHLPRAVASCQFVGVDALGVGDDGRARDAAMRRYQRRELGANVKLVCDALIRRKAGEGSKRNDVQVALASVR